MPTHQFHKDYTDKFPGQPMPEVGADAYVTGVRLAEVNKVQAAVLDAQKRFAVLAELIEELGLGLDPEDPHKLDLAALAARADNGRRAMAEARSE